MSSQSEKPVAWIRETTAQTFDEDVVQRSYQQPVVVDFWAPWCVPCRTLGPVLEKLVQEYAGRIALVKANTDQLPQAAAAFQVQSIPAVFGVLQGQPVDFFNGAIPESQIRVWLERLLQSAELLAAQRLEDSDPQAAAVIYQRLLDASPGDAAAAIGLARCLTALQQFTEARAIVDKLQQRGFLEPETEQIKAALVLQSRQDIDLEACRRKAEAAPGDLQTQLQYAEGLAGDGQYQVALELALSLVERDRQGVGEAARQLMVDIFRVQPGESELVRTYRRKLSMVLY